MLRELFRKEPSLNHLRTTLQDQEMKMKTTLLFSALAACVVATSTVTFAQQGGANWAQSYGDAAVAAPAPYYVVPLDRFTRSDLGYAGKVTRHHWTRP